VYVDAAGFAPFTTKDFVVTTQQVYVVPEISLSVSVVTANVTVRPTEVIAAEQIGAARKQRLVGGFPNFYVSYVPDARRLRPRRSCPWRPTIRLTGRRSEVSAYAQASSRQPMRTPVTATDWRGTGKVVS
jgi:hypothetical protein